MKIITFIILNIIVKANSGLAQDTANDGSAWAFRVFMDENMIFKLNNKRYSVHDIQTG